MDWLQQLPLEKFLLFTLVLTRLSGLVMTAPVYGGSDIPVQVRALFAFALALLMAPSQWHVAVAHPGSLAMFGVLVGSELLVGMVLGLGIAILFAGLDVAGQMIGQSSGLGVAELFDPSRNEEVSLFSRLMSLVALSVFVCIGGHRMVMAGLLDTYRAIPPGAAAYPASLADTFVTLAQQAFLLGIRACAPVLVAVLLANLVLGLISRTLPQLNTFALGFGINSLLTAGVLTVSLGAAVWVFQEQLEPTLESIVGAVAGTSFVSSQ